MDSILKTFKIINMNSRQIVFSSICLFVMIACNTKHESEEIQTQSVSTIEGVWKTISYESENKVIPSNQVKHFSNGHFILVSTDSAGNLTRAGYGTYEVTDSIYKERFTYYSAQEYTGSVDWQQYSFSGDTLIMQGFLKVELKDGKNLTDSFPSFIEKRIRIK
jgi:hypothetical protein